MSDKVPYEGIIKSLKSLVTLDIVFLLFSFVCAANIFLNRGYQMPATSATISYIQAQVKPASGILFLCAFGMFMTGGMGLIKLALWRSVLPKLSPGEDDPKEHVHWATDVLATANIERNAYLLRVYEEHRDANNELAWLSRLAQSCLVLAVIDGILSWKYSIIAACWFAVASRLGEGWAQFIVLLIAIFVSFVASRSFLQKNPNHIYLAGVENKEEIERKKKASTSPPPSPPLEIELSVPPPPVQYQAVRSPMPPFSDHDE